MSQGGGTFLSSRARNGCPLRTRAPRLGPLHSGITTKYAVKGSIRIGLTGVATVLCIPETSLAGFLQPAATPDWSAYRGSPLRLAIFLSRLQFFNPINLGCYSVFGIQVRLPTSACSELWTQPSVLACCLPSLCVTTDTEPSKIPQGET